MCLNEDDELCMSCCQSEMSAVKYSCQAYRRLSTHDDQQNNNKSRNELGLDHINPSEVTTIENCFDLQRGNVAQETDAKATKIDKSIFRHEI